MTAIAGTRRSMKELVDGTIRVQIDIDPSFRQQFFEIFGQIDMPVALAPLKPDFEQQPEEKPKGMALAKLAGMFCKEPKFHEFIEPVYEEFLGDIGPDEYGGDMAEYSRHCICVICDIESRAELDHNPAAARIFHEKIRIPFNHYCQAHRR